MLVKLTTKLLTFLFVKLTFWLRSTCNRLHWNNFFCAEMSLITTCLMGQLPNFLIITWEHIYFNVKREIWTEIVSTWSLKMILNQNLSYWILFSGIVDIIKIKIYTKILLFKSVFWVLGFSMMKIVIFIKSRYQLKEFHNICHSSLLLPQFAPVWHIYEHVIVTTKNIIVE